MATTFAVPDGRVAMAATTYTGTGATQTISNTVNTVGLQPDFVWIKRRDAVQDHNVYDSVRGSTSGYLNQLITNLTNAENSYGSGVYGAVSALNSNGFTVASSNSDWRLTNNSGSTYVGWQWKAGGTAVSNTAGTITSSVSANTTAGFSVVTYTGTGVAATVGHGLGVAPAMIFSKSRNNGSADSGFWDVYHVGLTSAAYFLKLNTTDGQMLASTVWNSTAPASTVYSIGSASGTNSGSAATYVAYCWAPVAGYSAFGVYTGNGSADGPFIYTGFRPRFILTKCSFTLSEWRIYDTSRDTTNVESLSLRANSSAAESTLAVLDGVSNGFKLRTTDADYNTSGQTYIYAAFAENPLKFSNAR